MLVFSLTEPNIGVKLISINGYGFVLIKLEGLFYEYSSLNKRPFATRAFSFARFIFILIALSVLLSNAAISLIDISS